MTDPIITADPSVVAQAPPNARMPARFYLPYRTANPYEPVALTTPVYRGNGGSYYTKNLNDYGFTLEEELGSSWPDALDDTVKDFYSPQRTRSRTTFGRHIQNRSERHLGYAFQHYTNRGKFDEATTVVVNGPTQTHTIKFDHRGGGQISNWLVQMAAPALEMQLCSRLDYGRAFQTATFFTEDLTGTPIRWNPTQAGSLWSMDPGAPDPIVGKVQDWESQPSCMLSIQVFPNRPDGSTRVIVTTAPADFWPHQDGMGGKHLPVMWPGAKQVQDWTFNYQGRDGVHMIRNRWYQPFEIPLSFGGPPPGVQSLARTQAFFQFPSFDEFWFYDAANDTDAEARQGIEGPAHDGSDGTDTFFLDSATWGSTGPRGPFLPHPIPSGIGGIISRSTGTLSWGGFPLPGGPGPANDFSIGHFFQMVPELTAQGTSGETYTQHNYQLTVEDFDYFAHSSTEDGKGPSDSPMGHFFHGAFNSFGAALGWHENVSFFCTGIYPTVKANMRQLYLDGLYGPRL
jgi:hypothetical protein